MSSRFAAYEDARYAHTLESKPDSRNKASDASNLKDSERQNKKRRKAAEKAAAKQRKADEVDMMHSLRESATMSMGRSSRADRSSSSSFSTSSYGYPAGTQTDGPVHPAMCAIDRSHPTIQLFAHVRTADIALRAAPTIAGKMRWGACALYLAR